MRNLAVRSCSRSKDLRVFTTCRAQICSLHNDNNSKSSPMQNYLLLQAVDGGALLRQLARQACLTLLLVLAEQVQAAPQRPRKDNAQTVLPTVGLTNLLPV